MSSVEAALAALKSAIETRLAAATYPVGWPGVPTVDFVDPAPDMASAAGIVIIPPGTIALSIVAFGPVYESIHRIAAQVYVDGANEADRVAVRDTIVREIAALATENQSLGGAIENIEAETNDRDNLGAKGSESTAASIVTLTMTYTTTSPLA